MSQHSDDDYIDFALLLAERDTAREQLAERIRQHESRRAHESEVLVDALNSRVNAFQKQLIAAGFTDPAPIQIATLAEQRAALTEALGAAKAALRLATEAYEKDIREEADGALAVVNEALRSVKAGRR